MCCGFCAKMFAGASMRFGRHCPGVVASMHAVADRETEKLRWNDLTESRPTLLG